MVNEIDVGDKDQVTGRKTKAQLQKEREREELRQLLGRYDFRRFLWNTLSACGVYKISFTGNSQTFFNEGKRDIGLRLIEEIFDADPSAYTKMRIEAKDREEGKNE